MDSGVFSQMGLTPGNYNYLKYWFSLTNDGREVFQTIFTWGYKGSNSEIKEALFNLDGYNNKRYRSDFDQSQRTKIESGNINEFDLSLFYLLIQRVCSFPWPSDKLWGKECDPERLPAILYQIKQKRNSSTHGNQTEITQQELKIEIKELKDLFFKALKAAGEEFKISTSDVNMATGKIMLHLDLVEESNSFDILEQIKKFTEEQIPKDLPLSNLHHILATFKMTENDLISGLASKITSLWKTEKLEFLGRPCTYTITPSFKNFQLKYIGKFWCPGWAPITGKSETKSQKGALEHAISDFAKQAIESKLVNEEEVKDWIFH